MANEVHGVPSEGSTLLEGTKVDGQVHTFGPFVFNIHDDEFAAVEGTSGFRIVSIPLGFKVACKPHRAMFIIGAKSVSTSRRFSSFLCCVLVV